MDLEVGGTKTIFDVIVETNIKTIIFSSSSNVYGDALEPMKEKTTFSQKST